jgi:cytidine deaminase
VTNEELIYKAISVLNPRKLSSYGAEAAGVGCAIKTSKGNIFTGVCIDLPCGIGFCAEHSAIAAMITAGETAIETIVAVDWDKSVLSPCGRCREFMYQIDDNNHNTNVIMPNGQIMTLKNLLPHHWAEKKVA